MYEPNLRNLFNHESYMNGMSKWNVVLESSRYVPITGVERTADRKPAKTSKRMDDFEPLKNVTTKDVERIVDRALARNFKVYDRLAEI